VNGVPAEQAEAVAVAWRMHDWQAHPAIRVGGVLMRDELAGPHRGPRRVFWLLDEGVQLIYEPFGWIDEWYVDVVCIQARRDDGQLTYHVTDEYADIIVEGMGPAYRMIDLDQLADAMSAASIDTARAPVRAGQLISHQHSADPDGRAGLPVVQPPGHRDRLSLLGRNAVHLTDPFPTPGVPFWHAPVGRRP